MESKREVAVLIGGGVLWAWKTFWIVASTLSTIDFTKTAGGHPGIGTFFLPPGVAEIVTLVGIGAIVIACVRLARRIPAAAPVRVSSPAVAADPNRPAPEERIHVVNKLALLDQTPGRRYPMKIYVEFVNAAEECIKVEPSRWLSGIHAELVSGILQLYMGSNWFPVPDGLGSLHVAPGQRFRLWIAPDKGRYKTEELQRLCDAKDLGTLMLRINDRERGFTL